MGSLVDKNNFKWAKFQSYVSYQDYVMTLYGYLKFFFAK